MKQLFSSAALLAAIPFCAGATTLAPAQGDVRTIASMTVVTYFVPHRDGFYVQLTVSKTDGDPASVVRFTSILADGQQTVLSVPREAGKAPLRLVVARTGAQLDVTEPVGE